MELRDSSSDLEGEILAICPEFLATWEAEKSLWSRQDGTYTPHGIFAVFSHHVANLLVEQTPAPLEPVFAWVEKKLTSGNESVSNAAATCFLENLMNRVPALFPFESFKSMLGPESSRFCRHYLTG